MDRRAGCPPACGLDERLQFLDHGAAERQADRAQKLVINLCPGRADERGDGFGDPRGELVLLRLGQQSYLLQEHVDKPFYLIPGERCLKP